MIKSLWPAKTPRREQDHWKLGLGPLIAVQSLGGQAAWGLIVQGGAIGALVGALVAVRLRPTHPLITTNVGLAFGGLPLVFLAVSAPAAVVAVAAGFMYAGLTTMQAMWNTAVHQHIPEHAMSRVLAYDWLVSLGLNPLGLALAGPLGAHVGNSTTLVGAAVLLTGSSLAVLAIPEVRRLEVRRSGRDDTVRPAEVETDQESEYVTPAAT